MYVGELNKRGLLAEKIMISIFDMVLAIDSTHQLEFINDDTTEGACVLMNKIGFLIDEKINKAKKEEGKEERKGVREKSDEMIKEYHKIFARFEELAYSEKCNVKISQRVKLLIRNMLDNREGGWEKSKKANESGPKKVADLRSEMEAKVQ